jgi:hypothetical protein
MNWRVFFFLVSLALTARTSLSVHYLAIRPSRAIAHRGLLISTVPDSRPPTPIKEREKWT